MLYLKKQINDYEKRTNTYGPENYDAAEDIDGNECLVQANANEDTIYVLTSKATGKILTENDLDENGLLLMDNQNNVYDYNYATNNMYQCTECYRWAKAEKGVFTVDGDNFYCIDCAKTNLYRCNDCGDWFEYEDSVEIGEYRNGERAVICQDCFNGNNNFGNGYFRCDRCGCIFPQLEGVEDEFGNIICNHCDEHTVLHSYHFAGDETDYGFRYLTISERLQKPLLGVELEMDEGGQNNEIIEQLLNILGSDYAVACRDGSLDDGFEMISCPANLENHKKTLHWADMMNLALRKGYRSHQPGTCGLHVHIDRTYFDDGTLTDKEIESVMYIILKNNIEWIKKFSRRANNGYDYCRINGDDDGVVIKDYDTYDKSWKKVNRFNRYQALNFSRSDTIEFRIFRGTLKERTFFATLEFVDMFARLAKQCETIESSYDIDFDTFAALADELGYTNFIEYCNEREIA